MWPLILLVYTHPCNPQACSSGDVEYVRSLLERGCPPDSTDYDNRTGLMLAAVRGHVEVAGVLLKWGANRAIKDNFGNTAVTEAFKFGRSDVLQELERHQLSQE